MTISPEAIAHAIPIALLDDRPTPSAGAVVVPARRARPAAYPRPGEPIVPALLAPLLDPALLATVADGSWRSRPRGALRLGLVVVAQLNERLAAAPEALRATPLPHPGAVVDRLPLDPRTVRLLRRAVASAPPTGAWTVGRYLAIARFGAHALVDLLAALEADPRSARDVTAPPPAAVAPPRRRKTAGAPVDADLCARAIEIVTRGAPISEAQVAAALTRAGAPAPPVDLGRIAQQATQGGKRPPFRLMRIARDRIAVEPSSVTTARAVHTVAARAVRYRGTASVAQVTEQARVMTGTPVEPTFVERLLAALTSFEWLDRPGGWFGLRSGAGSL